MSRSPPPGTWTAVGTVATRRPRARARRQGGRDDRAAADRRWRSLRRSERRPHRRVGEQQRAVAVEERDGVFEVLDDRFERRALTGQLGAIRGEPRASPP